MPSDSFEYDLFLSHNSKDKAAVQYLAARLEDESGFKIFLDIWNLVPGAPWQEALERALEKSRVVMVFLGPSGISAWHNEEMRAALNARAQDPRRGVIPVLLPGGQKPPQGKIPAFLRRLTWVAFQDSLDDEDALHRLVAGVRGQPPGRGADAGNLPPSEPESSPPQQEAPRSVGPVFHGNFEGTYVGRDQTNIQKYEDRSVNVHGALSGSTIITGDGNQVQAGPAPTPEEFSQLLAQIQAMLAQANLQPGEYQELDADLRTVVEQVEKPKPNKAIILKSLGGMVEFLANAATVATVAPQLAEMSAQALTWAKALF